MKNLAIAHFTVSQVTEKAWRINFAFTSDNGNGTCEGVCCESPDDVMTCVKQMLNNEWPGG